MKVIFSDIGQVDDKELKFAVISATYQGKMVFSREKTRTTWEIPGGHREPDEDITDTARREFYEETGAIDFDIKPICDYCVMRDGQKGSYGRLFYAEIKTLGDLPESEIGEVKLFDEIPDNLTYPEIQPYLYNKIVKEINIK